MASLGENINGQYSVMPNTRAYPQMIVTQLSQNTTTNQSQIRVIYRVQRPNTAWYVTGYYDHTPYIGASLGFRSQWVNFAQNGNSVETVLTEDAWVSHNADGTGSINVRWIGDLGTSWGTHDFNATVTLNTITRTPTVTTQSASSVTFNSATANGNVTDVGIPAITDKGIYWGTSSGNLPNKLSVGSGGAGAFTRSMTSLSASTTYYYKAYAQNANGYVYGGEVSFTTAGADTPVVSTSTTSKLNRKSVIFGGNVTNEGDAAVTERGIYYGTDEFSQTNKLTSTSGLGTYTIFLSGLTPNTKYYFKAFATSSIGTSYGDILNFTTGNSLSVNDKTAWPPFNKA